MKRARINEVEQSIKEFVGDAITLMASPLNMHHSRLLASIEPPENNGCGVSTIWANDLQLFETALLPNENSAIPVERYLTKQLALEGHKKWVEIAKNPTFTKVTKLGYLTLIPDQEVEFERYKSPNVGL
jgi:hypothetical protein